MKEYNDGTKTPQNEYVNRPTPLEAFRDISQLISTISFASRKDKVFVEEELDIIETTLKNYYELTSKPIILLGRTSGETQAIIDTICKNYKEVKIINLNDEKKLKALEIIKEKKVDIHNLIYSQSLEEYNTFAMKYNQELCNTLLTQEKYDLLKEVLL